MKYAAVLGFGTVGSGVVEVISGGSFQSKAGEDIAVKAVLDVRKFPDSPFADLITDDYQAIIEDKEISIVIETMGGITPAYEFTARALRAGKSVVTSNKELVAKKGAELIKTAREHGVSYLFEASVGGGIPIIRPLHNCLAANEIQEIMGILNGTTNYILTQMIQNGKSFGGALEDAQAKGYAERNPAADVEGHDTCRKIAILSALSYGKQIDSDAVPTEGITAVTLQDVAYAEKIGYVIKLIGRSKKSGGKVYARVSPLLLPKGHPLAGVEDVFNAILVRGSATGDVMFYGKGAGKLPTASAVVADCIDIVKHGPAGAPFWEDGGELTRDSGENVRFYLRIKADDVSRAENGVQAVFGKARVIGSGAGELAFLTPELSEEAFREAERRLEHLIGGENILGKLQVME
ncbi:MAG: homoserine dehydrogenase [Clostridiales bacterium]|jgi:homoserine dehydrogenase|nr:homoserine dehydrogenase [Clostridiales bacterium]